MLVFFVFRNGGGAWGSGSSVRHSDARVRLFWVSRV